MDEVHSSNGIVWNIVLDLYNNPCGCRQHRQFVAMIVSELIGRTTVQLAISAYDLKVKGVPPGALVGMFAVEPLAASPSSSEGQMESDGMGEWKSDLLVQYVA
jgi:hypothetical protein